MIEALSIQVQGIVQGVGFRPFVYRTALRFKIHGWVRNAIDGVHIHAEGESLLLDQFALELSERPPVAAQVKCINLAEVPPEGYADFQILFSDDDEVEEATLVSPDLGICDECAAELFNPEDRRYRYPFINCTDCGPRFTIIQDLPYDRPRTSMASFAMCPECAGEYEDPANRRFHAQPDACFACGPQLSWYVGEPTQVEGCTTDDQGVAWACDRQSSDAIIAEAVSALRQGKILAVKGLGGFHLVCDAASEQTVAELRARKRRSHKALACMVSSVQEARELCLVSDEEAAQLKSPVRPIVLLRKRPDVTLPVGLADDLSELGLMLPSTPLQHLLLHDFGGMLVMTSGNLHDEPIQTDDDQARRALAGVADAFLGNNRPILQRYDDSVIRVIKAGSAGFATQVIRRARGLAPAPLALPKALGLEGETASVFATGPEQKNTFCLTRGAEALVSQHQGDMENVETFDAWLESKEAYQRVFMVTPQLTVCDKHPEYLTSKWAAKNAHEPFKVQHHHAHIVSAMAENDLSGAVCGIAFDGTGYGEDGNIWGGEVLLSNLQIFERFANFAYVPMPGGAAAIKHPLRMAYGVLWQNDLLEHPGAADVVQGLGAAADLCGQMIESSLNTPYTSSVGRLFDAVSALLGVCTEPTYEGEGAVLLEAAISAEPAAAADVTDERYQVAITKNIATHDSTALDTSVLLYETEGVLRAILDDKVAGVPVGVIAKRFHDAMADAVLKSALLVNQVYGITTVVLSGGVFMNRYLTEKSLAMLEETGFTAVVNRDLPPNDGCISYGQAVVAWATAKNKA